MRAVKGVRLLQGLRAAAVNSWCSEQPCSIDNWQRACSIKSAAVRPRPNSGREIIAVAVSGGVDSAVAAMLLKQQGCGFH